MITWVSQKQEKSIIQVNNIPSLSHTHHTHTHAVSGSAFISPSPHSILSVLYSPSEYQLEATSVEIVSLLITPYFIVVVVVVVLSWLFLLLLFRFLPFSCNFLRFFNLSIFLVFAHSHFAVFQNSENLSWRLAQRSHYRYYNRPTITTAQQQHQYQSASSDT